MFNLTKSIVSRETAQSIVTRNFGNSHKITAFEELKEGYFNAAFRIELQDGLKCVLKVAPPPDVCILRYERDILRAEVETMQLVKSRTQMPIPAILFHDDTCGLLPSPFYAMEFVEGTPLHKLRPTLTSAEQAEIDQATGHYLRQMNAIQGETFGYYAQPKTRVSSWREAFDRILSNVLQDGRDAGVTLSMDYDPLLALTRQHSSVLDEVTTPALVHWDLWDGNIFVDPATKKITGIIDFERALWADPLMEVNFGAFGINPMFMEGYGMSLPFTSSQQTRRTLYNIYLFLIMVIECTYRNYPTHDQENWARGMLAAEIAKLS
jgi:aminoglycoside phosphotransferase (APT) family kinase protein